MKQLGRAITEEEAVLMMSEADADGDGSIDFMEFRKIVARKSKSKLWCAYPKPMSLLALALAAVLCCRRLNLGWCLVTQVRRRYGRGDGLRYQDPVHQTRAERGQDG